MRAVPSSHGDEVVRRQALGGQIPSERPHAGEVGAACHTRATRAGINDEAEGEPDDHINAVRSRRRDLGVALAPVRVSDADGGRQRSAMLVHTCSRRQVFPT